MTDATSRSADWLRGAVLYQIYPLSFLDGNGDGWGDLEGVLRGLDHVASLGVDGVWISPFYASPWKDFGYDVADHRAVDPRMGDLASFDRVLEKAHRLGLKIIVDLVCGHTSDAHPWFDASRRSRTGDHADWYVWADPQPDGTPPNNWLSVFGGAAWSWEPRRRQYYLHHFLASQPALNLHNPEAMQAACDTAAFWLERGVDGFRIDAVDFLAHDPLLRSNPALGWQGGEPPLKPFGLQRHLYDMMDPFTTEILASLRQTVDRYPGRVLLGELSSQPGAARRIASLCNARGLHAAYTLSLAKQPLIPEGFVEALTAADDPETICWSFANHDVPRSMTRWCPPGADRQAFTSLLAMLFASLPGTLCLYQGEELGLPDAVLRQDQLRDPFGIAYWPEFSGRDGSRTPMPWRSTEPNAGFSAAVETWLPVCQGHLLLAVDRQEGRMDSPLEIWREALRLRRGRTALASGAVLSAEARGSVLAVTRSWEGEELLCLFNLSGLPAEYPVGPPEEFVPLGPFDAVRSARQDGAGEDGLLVLSGWSHLMVVRRRPADSPAGASGEGFAPLPVKRWQGN